MTRDEKLKQFFEQMRDNGKLTAADIKNAAAATGNFSEIVHDILIYAAGMGININAELADLMQAQEKARQEKTIQDTAASIAAQGGELAKETDPEKQKNLIDNILRTVSSFESIQNKINLTDRIGTWDAFILECITYEPEKNFMPTLFHKLPFPPGTVSYIGARAKVGKPTA